MFLPGSLVTFVPTPAGRFLIGIVVSNVDVGDSVIPHISRNSCMMLAPRNNEAYIIYACGELYRIGGGLENFWKLKLIKSIEETV